MFESPTTHAEVERTPWVSEGSPKLAFDLNNIHVKPLAKKHKRGAFVCTNIKIQNYCRNNAAQNHANFMVRVFVACEGDSSNVLGYYYLALTAYKIKKGNTDSDGVHLDDLSDAKFGRVAAVPAVYLGMIGVDSGCQKRGIGKILMMDAIQRTAKIAEHAGTYALALDALDWTLVEYYREQFGFQTFKEGSGLEMFLPITTIMAAVPSEDRNLSE